MNRDQNPTASLSYFWSCIAFKDDCPFFSTTDPKLYYFGIGLASLYAAFILMILADLKFYWSIDNFQRQIDYYTNLVRKKVRHVQMDQRRLMSTQERTEKQLKRSQQCKHMVTALRYSLSASDHQQVSILTLDNECKEATSRAGTWCGSRSVIEF